AMGQAVVWYTGQFYTLFFLTQVLKVPGATANVIIVVATIVTAPLYVVFGTLSDRIGRKPLFLGGCLLAVLTFFPMYKALTHFVNPALEAAERQSPVHVVADPAECSFQFNPVGTASFHTSCDVARSALSKAGLSFDTRPAPAGTVAQVHIGDTVLTAYNGSAADAKDRAQAFKDELAQALAQAGYAATADPAAVNTPMAIVVVVLIMVCGTMTYGPLAAMFVEIFPTRIRYTAMSLPYHVGIGWFGGFLPAAAFAIVASTGDIYSGLWYPVIIAAVSAVVCLLFMKETRDVDIHAVE
ncbi:MAG: MFS transporter, partial [Betaproteobacteria bacterium]